jgi:hypothetical protein
VGGLYSRKKEALGFVAGCVVQKFSLTSVIERAELSRELSSLANMYCLLELSREWRHVLGQWDHLPRSGEGKAESGRPNLVTMASSKQDSLTNSAALQSTDSGSDMDREFDFWLEKATAPVDTGRHIL